MSSIVFIDSRVTGIDILLAALPAHTTAFVLDRTRDSLETIASILGTHTGLDSIQLISHGEPGVIHVGSTVLNTEQISLQTGILAAIGASLQPGGDFLIYGCDVAAGDTGTTFINALSSALGADVAASTDRTGAAALGGDWTLEASTGTIEAVGMDGGDGYAGVLDTTPPILLTFTPTSGSTGVAVGSNIVLTFDEVVRAGTSTGFITITDSTANTDDLIWINDSSRVIFYGSTIAIRGQDLAAGHSFVVTFSYGAVADLAGNAAEVPPYGSLNFVTSSLPVATLVSVANDGTQGNSSCGSPSVSADGRFVVFESESSNLVEGDTGGHWDIFLRDTLTNTTTLISRSNDGTQGNGGSYRPSISADGRFVVFYSDANNLAEGDNNGVYDVFLRDTLTNTTTLISQSTGGIQGSNQSFNPSISDDGRFVVFE
ncbi:DUF4347 domain-containing protein, partial [Candidatus Magnetobacterium casense]|uniref:DUF4347 domain-containing protein n=1 Tax=Candidatus Magnetobacterium casense TaxID=1455061 RepID=UPI0012DCC5B5